MIKKYFSFIIFSLFVFTPFHLTVSGQSIYRVEREVELFIGEKYSAIFTKEIQDANDLDSYYYVAFCFLNDSKPGRKILSKCKKEKNCDFTGEVLYETTYFCDEAQEYAKGRKFEKPVVFASLVSVEAIRKTDRK